MEAGGGSTGLAARAAGASGGEAVGLAILAGGMHTPQSREVEAVERGVHLGKLAQPFWNSRLGRREEDLDAFG